MRARARTATRLRMSLLNIRAVKIHYGIGGALRVRTQRKPSTSPVNARPGQKDCFRVHRHSGLGPVSWSEYARFVLIFCFQLDLRRVALYFKDRAKGLGRVGQSLQNIAGSGTRRRRGQAAGVEELVVGVLVVNVGLALAEVVQGDCPEGNRLQIRPLKLDVRDRALP